MPTSLENNSVTLAEIQQQPETWLNTLALVTGHPLTARINASREGAVISGAGTSAYAASAVEAAWQAGARAIPTTDLVTEAPGRLPHSGMMLSLARSGNSPESIAAVDRVRRFHPSVMHYAITCNAEGELARHPDVSAMVLDPRTNDRGLAMTSSFSNLVLAGLCVARGGELNAALPDICRMVSASLPALSEHAEAFAARTPQRMVVLAPPALFPCAREVSLKILEMTAGSIAVLPETFLGLRHGPMSFVDRDTLVLAFLSSDANTRRYEQDLLGELRSKGLGRLAGVLPPGSERGIVDEAVPAMAGTLPDELRTPFEVVYGQLLAYHLSRRAGLDPDNPSPAGVISRVVQGVRIYGE